MPRGTEVETLATLADRDEIMRRFHHGLASGLTGTEARGLLKGMVVCVCGRDVGDLDIWTAEQMEACRSDPRWKNIPALVMNQKRLS